MVDWKIYIDSPLTKSLEVCGGSLTEGDGYGDSDGIDGAGYGYSGDGWGFGYSDGGGVADRGDGWSSTKW